MLTNVFYILASLYIISCCEAFNFVFILHVMASHWKEGQAASAGMYLEARVSTVLNATEQGLSSKFTST